MKPSLLNDILFKIVFGSDRSEFILRPLLNALLGLTGPQRILHLHVTNPTLPKAYFQDKGVILDVSARDEAGRRYNIEVQLRSKDDYIQRSLYYLARLFSQQLKKGKAYDRLPKNRGNFLTGLHSF